MIKLGVFGVAALAVTLSAADAMARGAVSGGVRGAAVGGMMGGSAGAATGAKIGAVAGATQGVAQRQYDRSGMDAETQTRNQYYATPAYQSAQYSNFNQAPPEIMVASQPAAPATTAAPTTAAAPGGETVIRKAGKPVVGITFPPDWKQKVGNNNVTAVSSDGHVWSVLATIDGVKDQEAAIKQIQQQLEKYLSDIDFDDLTKTERGALLTTGTGKSKKTGHELVFAAGVFDAGGGQLAGAAFVVDKGVEDHYKEAVKYTCQTIRGAEDLAGQAHEVAKPVIGN